MVYKCFVYGCKSHKIPRNTTFGIPKEPELKEKWAKVLEPYSNGKELQSNKHRVCKAHFVPEDMDFYYVHYVKGTEVKIERGRPELKKGAVPSIFPGQKKIPRRRPLVRNNEVAEAKKQSILLLNGEWVHLKKPKISTQGPNKVTKNSKAKKKPKTKLVKDINVDEQKSQRFSNKADETSDQDLLVSVESVGNTENESPERKIHPTDYEPIVTPELPPAKPPDKEQPSICINWDALPLLEEIGSLLCDSSVPHFNANSDFEVKQTNGHLLSTSPPIEPPSDLQSELTPDLSLVEVKPENSTTMEATTEVPVEEEDSLPFTFQALVVRINEVQLPSPLWGFHTDFNSVYFSCISYDSTNPKAVPTVAKIVMFKGTTEPRIFLRGKEVQIPSKSGKFFRCLEEVDALLFHVEKLRICLGAVSVGDAVTFSSSCDIFIDSMRVARCPACRQQRSANYSKKRHLETDSSKTNTRSTKRKQLQSNNCSKSLKRKVSVKQN